MSNSSSDSGCGCLLFFVAVIIALLSNPSLEDGKKKVEGDTSYRALIQNNDVRLYRDGYFIFSEYYVGVGTGTPTVYGIGVFGFIIENEKGGLNKSGKFNESVKLE